MTLSNDSVCHRLITLGFCLGCFAFLVVISEEETKRKEEKKKQWTYILGHFWFSLDAEKQVLTIW